MALPVIATGADVDDAVAPPAGHPRFPLVDSVRALAAIAVVCVHAAIFSGALDSSPLRRVLAHLDIGVPVFFLLSGFLLYRPMLAARLLGAPRTSTLSYARRRLLRIAPAYWVSLTVLAVVPGVYGVLTHNWWVYYGLLQNYPVYGLSSDCRAHPFQCGDGVAWTLTIEVGFYAVLPLFAFVMARLGALWPRRGWLAVELAVLAALAVVSVLIQGLRISYSPWVFFSPLGRAWWFGLGMAIAALSVWTQQRGQAPRAVRWLSAHPGWTWTAAGVLYLGASQFVLHVTLGPFPLGSVREYVLAYVLWGVVGALLLVPVVFGERTRGWPRRLLGRPSVRWLGLISYGIYLWHYPIVVALANAGVASWWPAMGFPVLVASALAISVACAATSYYLVERPLMRLGRRRPATG